MSEVFGWFTGTDDLYHPLLPGIVNNAEDLSVSAMDFAPGMLLDPLLDSRTGFGAVYSENAFASATIDRSELPNISKIEYPPNRFADVKR